MTTPPPASYRHAHWYFLAALAVVAAGFWQSFVRPMGGGSAAHTMHGITATLWVVALALQSWLMSRGLVRWHRRVAYGALVLLPVMVVSALQMVAMMFANPNIPPFLPPLLAFIDLPMLAFLVLLVVLALRNIRRPAAHKRLMAATVLLGFPPALTRLYASLGADFMVALHGSFVTAEVILVALIIADRRAGERRLAYPMSLGFFVLVHALMVPVGFSAAWARVMSSYVQLVTGAVREPSLSLRLVSETALEDSGRTALGAIGGFNVTDAGEYLVADRQRGSLVVFDADGRRLREIGRRGEGPGEWSAGPYGVMRYDERHWAVSDGTRLKVLELARPREAWIRTQGPMTAAFAAYDGVIYARNVDRDRRSSIARYRNASDSLEYGGPFPSQLGRSRIVDMMLTFVAAAPVGDDRIAVFIQGSDYLFVGPFGGPYDSVHVPAIARRGAMRDLLDAVRDDDPESGMRAAYKASFPFRLRALSDGRIAIVTLDQEFLGDRMSGSLQVAVVKLGIGVSCGEVTVPVDTDPQPWVEFRGDTLLVFSHDVDEHRGEAQPMVRRFAFDIERC
ncbi:MAG: hypothetical protein KF689_00735 [Gemmatimonadaceae bacterium]|nr:hypothetical protein [Gemmatimonadaceae bacterium]MCW5826454.1 hypothetical protein [Gemmatimonadaceae bacterium]